MKYSGNAPEKPILKWVILCGSVVVEVFPLAIFFFFNFCLVALTKHVLNAVKK